MADPEHDEILRKADALLRRHRAARDPENRERVDFPVLTEVVPELQVTPNPPSIRSFSDEELAQYEQDLRLQLLDLLGPEFERLIETKIQERLGAKIDEVMTLTRTVIEAEVRAVIRAALAEVIAAETERIKINLDLG
jgi:hypothetical protein